MESGAATLKGRELLSDLRLSWGQIRDTLSRPCPGDECIEERETLPNTDTPITRVFDVSGDYLRGDGEDVGEGDSHTILDSLSRVRDLLEPLRRMAKEKKKDFAHLRERGPIRVGSLLGVSRRLAPHTRPPPEYSDPSGQDAFCVPGYLFPCPDLQMMLRSTLFLGGAPQALKRCLPPEISVTLEPGYTSLYKLRLKSTTPNAKLYCSINLDALRPYNAANPPTLTAPGEYNVQAYATAPDTLPSELVMNFLTLKVAESSGGAASIPSAPSVVAGSKAASAFSGLFLAADDDEEDEDEDDDSSDGGS